MSSSAVHEDVERLARELCASEGWDPDEQIECEPAETVAPREAGIDQCFCARWEPYAMAAQKMIAARDDDWDTF